MNAQWNGSSVTKPNPENCENCSFKCAYDCAQLQYTIQHRTVLMISRRPSFMAAVQVEVLSVRVFQ